MVSMDNFSVVMEGHPLLLFSTTSQSTLSMFFCWLFIYTRFLSNLSQRIRFHWDCAFCKERHRKENNFLPAKLTWLLLLGKSWKLFFHFCYLKGWKIKYLWKLRSRAWLCFQEVTKFINRTGISTRMLSHCCIALLHVIWACTGDGPGGFSLLWADIGFCWVELKHHLSSFSSQLPNWRTRLSLLKLTIS